MSFHIVLNQWSGEDQDLAAAKMAKVFRLEAEEASDIVERLVAGDAWQFQHQVSDPQSEVAESYLTNLGFDVARHSVTEDHFDENGEIFEEDAAAPGTKPGLFAKIWAVLTKKR